MSAKQTRHRNPTKSNKPTATPTPTFATQHPTSAPPRPTYYPEHIASPQSSPEECEILPNIHRKLPANPPSTDSRPPPAPTTSEPLQETDDDSPPPHHALPLIRPRPVPHNRPRRSAHIAIDSSPRKSVITHPSPHSPQVYRRPVRNLERRACANPSAMPVATPARRSTRLSTGSIKKVNYVNDLTDDIDHPPPTPRFPPTNLIDEDEILPVFKKPAPKPASPTSPQPDRQLRTARLQQHRLCNRAIVRDQNHDRDGRTPGPNAPDTHVDHESVVAKVPRARKRKHVHFATEIATDLTKAKRHKRGPTNPRRRKSRLADGAESDNPSDKRSGKRPAEPSGERPGKRSCQRAPPGILRQPKVVRTLRGREQLLAIGSSVLSSGVLDSSALVKELGNQNVPESDDEDSVNYVRDAGMIIKHVKGLFGDMRQVSLEEILAFTTADVWRLRAEHSVESLSILSRFDEAGARGVRDCARIVSDRKRKQTLVANDIGKRIRAELRSVEVQVEILAGRAKLDRERGRGKSIAGGIVSVEQHTELVQGLIEKEKEKFFLLVKAEVIDGDSRDVIQSDEGLETDAFSVPADDKEGSDKDVVMAGADGMEAEADADADGEQSNPSQITEDEGAEINSADTRDGDKAGVGMVPADNVEAVGGHGVQTTIERGRARRERKVRKLSRKKRRRARLACMWNVLDAREAEMESNMRDAIVQKIKTEEAVEERDYVEDQVEQWTGMLNAETKARARVGDGENVVPDN